MIFDRRSIPTDAIIAMMPAPDGWPLRTYFQPARGRARGSILWLGGRGDIFEKYLESLSQWAMSGRSVTSFDWRGQGGSGRLGSDPRVGHVNDFATWVSDLTVFFDDWRTREPGPHFVIGHSMGGHLLLRALAERLIAPDAVVLSAPMLGFSTGPMPFALAASAARLMAHVTSSRHSAWSSNEKPTFPGVSRQHLLTHDDARYADELWWKQKDPNLLLGPPSWRWLAAAFRSIAVLLRPQAVEHVAVPILIVGTDGDQLVSARAIRSFAGRLPKAKLFMLAREAAHEILREADVYRDPVMAEISDFLDAHS